MRILLRLLAVLSLSGVLVGTCFALLIPGVTEIASGHHFTGDIGELEPLAERTIVYDNAGNVIGVLGLTDRQPATLDEVPDVLVDAVIATEDQSFWDNPGVDVQATMRAFWANVGSGDITQGGSTITQQLVKNRILSPRRDLDRKLREFVLAVRMDNQFTKAEILEQYLNTVYFGQGAYGVKSGAERLFRFADPQTGAERGKALTELTLADAALMAGLISNPEGNNPFYFPERAAERRSEVLDQMVAQGYVGRADADLARTQPLPTVLPPAELRPDNYFVEEVQNELLDDPRLGATQQERYNALLQGGLRVYTTLDPGLQFLAQAAVADVLPASHVTAATSVIDSRNGHVLAIVAGPGFTQSQFNLVTDGGRQPGSTYKVITLAAALESGISPESSIDGSSPCRMTAKGYGEWQTRNAGDGGGGSMSLRRATTGSVNCAYARLISRLGTPPVIDMAHRLGIRPENELCNCPSITLGTDEASPLEMTTVFATLGNDGVRHDPVFVTRVETADGELVFSEPSSGVRALDTQIARTEIDILQGVFGGTGGRARIDWPAYGKTGTTDGSSDAWFCGGANSPVLADGSPSPERALTACVWVGRPDSNQPMGRVGQFGSVYGGTYPAMIWQRLMAAAMDGTPSVEFPGPAGAEFDDDGVRSTDEQLRDDLDRLGSTTSSTTSTVPPDTAPPTSSSTPPSSTTTPP